MGVGLVSARYEELLDVIVLQLSNGLEIRFAPAVLSYLESVESDCLADMEITDSGAGLSWKRLGVECRLDELLVEVMGEGSKLLFSAIGRRGGKVITPAKSEASRRNGRKRAS